MIDRPPSLKDRQKVMTTVNESGEQGSMSPLTHDIRLGSVSYTSQRDASTGKLR